MQRVAQPFFYCLLFLCCKISNAQTPAYKHYDVSNGLPTNEVYEIKQDRKGFLWIGCDAGLVRYDGNAFTLLSNKKNRGPAISGLREDKQGRIWCTNFSGQVFFTDGDSQTRSLSLYEIEKSAIDPSILFEIAEFDQQEYTAPVKDLFIKCRPGNNDVQVTGYVDWTANADKFSWSFISVTAYDKRALEQMEKEINNWLSH